MTWHEILNKKDLSWIVNSNGIDLSKNPREIAFKMHEAIFNINESSFWKYIDFLKILLNLEKDNKLIEVGCGNGSLLLGLNQIVDFEAFGLDISEPLIEVCKNIFPTNKENFELGTLPKLEYDKCLLNSVSQYLNEELILKLINDTKCPLIVISDVKNALFESKFKLQQAHRQNLTLNELNQKYKNTPLKHYYKSFFEALNYDVEIQSMPDFYPDSDFGSYVVTIKK